MPFRDEFSFGKRLAEASSIRKKYPDRVPVVVEIARTEINLPPLGKKKYLVPLDMKMGEFIYTIRGRMRLKSTVAVFMFVGDQNGKGILPCPTDLLITCYHKFASRDGFLYFELHSENVFGAHSTFCVS